jgi:hypothetical protein
MKNPIKSISALLILLAASSAFAFPVGVGELGTKTLDGKYILPLCGVYNFSRKTSVPACTDSGDAYQLSPTRKINYWLQSDYIYGERAEGAITDGMFPYSYEDGYIVFANVSFLAIDVHNSDEVVANNKTVKIELFDLKNPMAAGMDGKDAQANSTSFKIEGVNVCWQVLLNNGQISAICADKNAVYYVRGSLQGQEKVQLFTAAQVGTSAGYLVVPNLALDPNTLTWRNDNYQEDLGGGIHTFPKGYVDLKTGKFTFIK